MQSVLPRTKTVSSSLTFISMADEAILQAVNRYHLATADQLCRLLYSAKSIHYVRSRASHLADSGYLLRTTALFKTKTGPIIYSLGPQGRKYLASLRVPVPERLRKDVVTAYGYGHLKHALGVTDVLLAADLLAKADEHIRVQTVLHEHALKRKGIRVTLPDGAREPVCPDAWLDMRVQRERGYRTCIAVEFDRGTEHQPAWRQKVQAILAWARGPYITTFGTESLTVAVIVDAGEGREQRCRTLVSWTEAELDAQGARREADLFCFTACDPATVDPAHLFLGRSCAVPFDSEPTSLLAVTRGGV